MEASLAVLELIDSYSDIERKVNQALAEEFNAVLGKSVLIIRDRIRELVGPWIASQPEILSLGFQSGDSLAGYFGIPVSQVGIAIESIILSVQNSVHVNFTKLNKDLKGGFSIYVQPSDFQNLLSLSVGHVVYERGDLHWLDWLLTKGSSIIIANYEYSPKSGAGRSGLGTMSIGGSFRVPPAFSGTEQDNFITRALVGGTQFSEIEKIIKSVLL